MKLFPPTPLNERLATGLAKLGLVMKSKAWRLASAEKLTPTQGQILTQLLSQGPGGSTLQELAAGLGVRPPTATEAVSALERKKLVVKRRDPQDHRLVRIRLTRKGAAAARRVSSWPDFLAHAISRLDQREQASLLGALTKMIRHLQERGEIPLARMCVQCLYFQPNAHRDPRRPHHCHFVDAAFGERDFRLDCPDFQPGLITISQRRQSKCPSQVTPTEPPRFHARK
ncbi:MAG: MarR family winged helix-turn-helix transcriptional regulator [Bryobacteraceae bacterium]|nr:MarR family winged helix-turn-helix transcriptional regulator [Bryobacteraceae bacterium]